LPDPNQLGNAGSFFKNPVVSVDIYNAIREIHPDAPSYPASKGNVKMAAGWLIEKAGWKGFTRDHFGVHKNQALVLVNYGGATGSEIWNLSSEIIQSIEENFKITLEREVNIL
jgi:UDP-N-acetylmuramate dehydrogenase